MTIDENGHEVPVIASSGSLFTAPALQRAIDALIATGNGLDLDAASMIAMILGQRGCADIAGEDCEYLTNLMDVIVCG